MWSRPPCRTDEAPVLSTSVKTYLIEPTLDRREGFGDVCIFDPEQQTKYEWRRRPALRAARTSRAALRVAHRLAGSAMAAASDLRDADFWLANAES